MGRAKTAPGSPACFPFIPLARGCRRIWRGVVLVYWFRRRDAARPDRAAWAVQRLLAARWRGRRPDRHSWLRAPRVNPFCHPYAREGQAVVCPLLRGSSPTRWVAPKQHRGLRRAFPLSLGAWVPKNLARRSFGLLVSAARCCSTGSGRLDLDLLISGPRVNLFYPVSY